MDHQLHAEQVGSVASEIEQKKRFATLQAKAALAGVALHRLCDSACGSGGFLVSKWNLTTELPSLDAVDAWLNQLSGVSHGF
jgi:hypothetical protein